MSLISRGRAFALALLTTAFVALAPSNAAAQNVYAYATPDGGTYNGDVTISIVFCSDWNSLNGSHYVDHDGTDVSGNFSGGQGGGNCTPAPDGGVYSYTISGTLNLNAGQNCIYFSMFDYSWNLASGGACYYRNSVSVSVTPDGGTAPTVQSGQSNSYTFTVSNTGSLAGTFNLYGLCGNYPIINCNPSQSSVYLGGGESANIAVSYTGWQVGSTALYLTATYTGNSSITNDGVVYVTTIPKAVATVTVARTGPETIGTLQTSTFSARTYASDGEELTGRSVSWSAPNTSVSPSSGTSVANTTVTGTVPGTWNVWATSEGVSGSNTINVVAPTYAVTVSPDSPPTIHPPAGATSTGNIYYTVTNNNQYVTPSSTYSLSVSAGGAAPLSGCTRSPTSVTLAPGQTSGVITVSCTVGATTSASSGTVTLTASTSSPGSASHSYTTNVNVTPYIAVTVVPVPTSKTEPALATSGSTQFRIYNQSVNAGGSVSISYSRSCSGVPTCSGGSSVTVAEGTYQTVTVSYGMQWVGQSGTVSVTASLYGASHTGNMAVYATPTYGVVVTREHSSQTLAAGSTSGSTRFTINNTSTNTGGNTTYNLAASCNGPFVTGCSASPSSITLGDQSASSTNAVTINYSTGLTGASGNVTLTASASSPGSSSHAQTTTVNATAVYAVSVTPNSPSTTLAAQTWSGSTSYTIQNNSTNTNGAAVTFTLGASCGGVAGCSGTQSVSLVPGASAVRSIGYSVSSVGVSGAISMTASSSSPSMSGIGSAWIYTTPAYSVSVVPSGSTQSLPALTTTGGTMYTITNTGTNLPGSGDVTFTLSASCGSGFTSGCSPSASQATVGQTASTAVNVSFDVGAHGTNGSTQLTATSSSPSFSGSGSQYIDIEAYYGMSLTRTNASQTLPAGSTSGSTTFTLSNTSRNTGGPRIFSLSATCGGPFVISCSPSQALIELDDQASTTAGGIAINYNTSLSGQTGNVTLTASSSPLGQSQTTTVNATPAYIVAVVPTAPNGALPPRTSQDTARFTIQNNSTNTATGSATFTLSASCAGVTSCSYAPTTVTLADGSIATNRKVSFNVATVGTTGTVIMTATASSPSFSNSGTQTINTTPYYAAQVTPVESYQTPPPRSASGSAVITVRNLSENTPGDLTLATAPSCSQVIYNCSVTAGSVTLAQSAQQNITVNYSINRDGTIGTAGVQATSSSPSISETGATTVNPAPSYTIAVVPGSASSSVSTGSKNTHNVQIENTSWNTGSPITVGLLGTTCSNTTLGECTVPPGTHSLSQGALTPALPVRYAALAAGSETVTLSAQGSAASPVGSTGGSLAVTVSNASALTLVTAGVNPGTTIDRGDCLTIAAGAAAVECGDLRVAHGLPATVTMNKARSPVLFYNSRHVRGGALLAANVMYASGSTPDKLVATATINGQEIVREYPYSTSCASTGCRIVVPVYATATMGTGVYPFQLRIEAKNGTTTLHTSATVTDTAVIVNRSTSPFGTGWWLAGLEQLTPVTGDSTRLLWVGGDGSTRLYARSATDPTVYTVEPAYDRPDTLKREGGLWRRRLGDGAYVEFTSTLLHQRTRNAQGHETYFDYVSDGYGTRLTQITLPVPSGSGASRTYQFDYGYPGGVATLDSVTASPQDGVARSVQITSSGGARTIAAIRDPDNATVSFNYDDVGRLTQRINRLTDLTAFDYDSGGAVMRSRINMTRTPSSPNVETEYHIAETRSVRLLNDAPFAINLVSTMIDGPLPDTLDRTRFYVDNRGAVVRSRNALGDTSAIAREDARFPALVTRQVSAVGFVQRAWYNHRALIDSTAAVDPYGPSDTADAVTRYIWHGTWNQPATVIPPLGEPTSFGYEPSTALRIWQQPGYDPSRRVNFYYHSGTNLLANVIEPGLPAQAFSYDPSLGNLSQTQTPKGYQTRFVRDHAGRDSVVRVQIDTVQTYWREDSTTYDRRGRVVRSVAYGPMMLTGFGHPALPDSTPARFLTVTTEYDAEGNARSVTRSGAGTPGPLHPPLVMRTGYDALGRVLADTAVDGAAESWVYDAAGNARFYTTRRGQVIETTYDLLGRVLTRSVPSVTYPVRTGIGLTTTNLMNTGFKAYPWVYTGQDSFTVAGDVQTFVYGKQGLTSATNADAFVRRSYYPNGSLRTDSTTVWTIDRTDTTAHRYGLRYEYDRSGRLRKLVHPSQLAPSAGDSVVYVYNTLGDLQTVRDLMGNTFTFNYNVLGRRIGIGLPGGLSDSTTYDADGRVIRSRMFNRTGTPVAGQYPGTVLRDQNVRMDAMGRMIWSANTFGLRDTVQAKYWGHGPVAWRQMKQPASADYGIDARLKTDEFMSVDAFANRSLMATYDSGFVNGNWANTRLALDNQYFNSSGRLRGGTVSGKSDTVIYDPAGNTELVYTDWADSEQYPVLEERANYYGADNRLRWAEWRRVEVIHNQPSESWKWFMTWDEYRYDALGRRLLVNTQRDCYFTMAFKQRCKIGTVVRTVWNGDAELYEIRMPLNTVYTENDVAAVHGQSTGGVYSDVNRYFGRVAYNYGSELDRPLSITRMAYGDTAQNGSWLEYPAFTVVPHWDIRGSALQGTMANGSKEFCAAANRCATVRWPHQLHAFAKSLPDTMGWYGSLITDKTDPGGMQYKRNRYVDPATGRFTQEDPIGLAGGMNQYGFAGGDPVNYGDPFGLSDCDKEKPCPNPVKELTDAFVQAFVDLYIKALDIATDALDLVLKNKSIATAGGLDPSASTTDRVLAGVNVATGMPNPGPRVTAGAMGHIFRNAAGHVNPATVGSKARYVALFERVAAQGTRSDELLPQAARNAGAQMYTQTFKQGTVWVHVFNGQIRNAGVNFVP